MAQPAKWHRIREQYRDEREERGRADDPLWDAKRRLATIPIFLWTYVAEFEGGKPRVDQANQPLNLMRERDLSEIQQRVAEFKASARKANWKIWRTIAALYCAALELNPKHADEVLKIWDIAISTARMGASLARAFPPHCEDPFLSQNWYWELFTLAKLELGIERPVGISKWNELSDHCVRLFAIHRDKSISQLMEMIEMATSGAEPSITMNRRVSEDGTITHEGVFYADKAGNVHILKADGKPGKSVTLKKVLAERGIKNQQFRLVLEPISESEATDGEEGFTGEA